MFILIGAAPPVRRLLADFAGRCLPSLHQEKTIAGPGLSVITHTYGRFTEGFATPDLRDAEALLKELSVRSS
jgi:hypothetical protein